jgi:hypothetical protein
MNWKGCGWMRSWRNLRYYPRNFLGGNEEDHENLGQESRSPEEPQDLLNTKQDSCTLTLNLYEMSLLVTLC